MNNKNSKPVIIIAILFVVILITTAIASLITGDWINLFLSLLTIVCISLTFIITYFANAKEIMLPPSIQLSMLLFIFSTQYLGEIRSFYFKFWWWDLLLHAISGAYVVVIAFYLASNIIRKNQRITVQRFLIFTAIFAFNFSVSLGVLWEMFEFVGDYLFKTKMIKGGIEDTATDMFIKIAAAFITSIIYYFKSKKKFRNEFI